jgi:enoyl-CoA hydratase/carnithine racemase
MKTFEFENNELEFYIDESIAVIKFKENTFENFADMEKTGKLLDLLDWVEQDPLVHAVMIENTPEAFDEKSYERFMNVLLKRSADDMLTNIMSSDKKILRARQMNAFRNLITKIVDYQKIFIFALRGCIVTPIFGLSLSADFRFAADDLCFNLAHMKYGLHPSGALPFFLPRFLSQSRVREILYKGGKIHAREALDLLLINNIISNGEFEKRSVEEAKKIASIDPVVMRLTKKLTTNFSIELERYFDMESKLVGF